MKAFWCSLVLRTEAREMLKGLFGCAGLQCACEGHDHLLSVNL